MSNIGDTIKGLFSMNAGYDDYDEYEDYEEYDEVDDFKPTQKPIKQEPKRSIPKPQQTKDVQEDDFEEVSEKPTRAAFAKRPSRASKVVPMNNERNRNIKAEIFTIKPTSLDNTKDIVDTLLEGKAVIINIEGVNMDLAQRIIDNICGACCAINGTLKKVSTYIYLVAPESFELYGDFSDTASASASANSQYAFKSRYQY